MLARRRFFCLLVAGLMIAWLASPHVALAHVGAPYPVLLEQPVGAYIASALADPDVGTGTFYILVDLADDQPIPPDRTDLGTPTPRTTAAVAGPELEPRQTTVAHAATTAPSAAPPPRQRPRRKRLFRRKSLVISRVAVRLHVP